MAEDPTLMRLIIQRMDEIAREQKSLAETLRQSEHSSSESRRRVYEQLNEHTKLLLDQGARLASVERSVEVEAPTWAEYRAIKARALGAGMLGKTLWRFGAWLIGIAAGLIALRHDIVEFVRWLLTTR